MSADRLQGAPPAPRRVLALLLALLVLVKATLVFSLGDVFFYGEELEKGAAAKAVLDGIDVPYSALPFHTFEGGGFVISHLKVLAFLLVGESVFAHKLAALLVCALTLAAGFRMLARHFGARAALLFGLFYVFAPESYQKITLLSLGTHCDAMLFLILVLDLALGALFRSEDRPRDLALLGLVAGFGCYFNYHILLFVGFVGLWMAVSRPRLVFGRPGLAGILGFVAGLTPLLLMLASIGERVFDIHGDGLLARALNFDRLANLLGEIFSHESLRSRLGAWTYLLTLIGCGLYLWPFGPRSGRGELTARSAPMLGFLLLWLLIYATSTFVLRSIEHYLFFLRLSPGWMLFTLLAAIGLGAAWDDPRRGPRGLARAAAVAMVVIGVAHTAAIVAAGRPGSPAANARVIMETKGYLYSSYFARVIDRIDDGSRTNLAPLLDFEEPDRPLLLNDLASEAFKDSRLERHEVGRILQGLDPSAEAEFEKALGHYLIWNEDLDYEKALERARGIPGSRGDHLLEALGRTGANYWHSPAAMTADVERVHAAPRAVPVLRGIGYRIGRQLVYGPFGGPTYILRPDAGAAFIETMPAGARPHLSEGFAEACALMRLR